MKRISKVNKKKEILKENEVQNPYVYIFFVSLGISVLGTTF